MEDGFLCLVCCKGKLNRVKVYYRVFEEVKKRQPDFICDLCGTPFWNKLSIFKAEIKPPPLRKEGKKQKRRNRRHGGWGRTMSAGVRPEIWQVVGSRK